jgi:hypothetical protein
MARRYLQVFCLGGGVSMMREGFHSLQALRDPPKMEKKKNEKKKRFQKILTTWPGRPARPRTRSR